jgi:hypothetical protein
VRPGKERQHAGEVRLRGNGGSSGEAIEENTGKIPFLTGFYSGPNISTYIKKHMDNKQQLQQLLEEMSTVTKEMAHLLGQEVFDPVEYDDYHSKYMSLVVNIDRLSPTDG